MIFYGGADDISVVLLLLQTSNADAHQYRVNLRVADSSRPGGNFRKRNTNAGFILNRRKAGDRRLRLRPRAKIPGNILKVHCAIGIT